MMGDCEPGFEFSGMAVLAMQICGYSCLNPRNWGGKRAKASTKSKAYESRAHGVGGGNAKVEVSNATKRSDDFIPAPKKIEGISGLPPAKPKTSVQGGGGLRKRSQGKKGNIYEWDSQHGAVEKYNKRGKHQGEFDPMTGKQNKAADKTRTVGP